MCENKLRSSRTSKVICECMYLVTRGHFRSRDKDGGNTIRSAIAENPIYTQTSWYYSVCFIEGELLPIEVLHCGNWDFLPFLLL